VQIVFVHGSGQSGACWQLQTVAFPGSDALDLPGHPDGELLPSIEACVDWLKARIDRKGYEDIVLVGHSIGGAIAMLYALNHPEDLAAMVLVGSGARLRVMPQMLEMLERAVDDPELLAPLLRQGWEKVQPELAEGLLARSQAIGAAAFLSDLRACDRFDIIERLGDIRTRTLAICGTEDVMTPPKYSQFLADRIPGAEVVFIEGGTHMVFLEHPDTVNRAIADFLEELG
jgi:pimeloyl-ACP methyl ester carboxylesterase